MIDLRSDALVSLTEAQRHAARNAALGDDFYDENPLTLRFEGEMAALLGKEAALLVPTGTVGNAIAILGQIDHPQNVLLDRQSHLQRRELGPNGLLPNLQPKLTDTASGIPDATGTADWLRGRSGRAVVCLENTHLGRGGKAYPPALTRDLVAAVRRHRATLHLDGARLFHAACATHSSPRDLAAVGDSVMVSLVKGLGIPAGAILAGPASFIEAARERRMALGATLRWTGWIAACGLEALKEGFDFISDDIRKARLLAETCHEMGVGPASVDTNIVLLDTRAAGLSGGEFAAAAKQLGLLVSLLGPDLARLATSRKVTDSDVAAAQSILRTIVRPGARSQP
jgi:threonine aldolase